MYGAEDPSIAGMVLDSPFSNLVELMMELVDMYKYPLPKFTVSSYFLAYNFFLIPIQGIYFFFFFKTAPKSYAMLPNSN